MASAQMSGFGVTLLRGTVGGNTIQLNANGLFIREKPIPTQPGTSYQTEQQARFVAVVTTWETLTDEQRTAWIEFAETSAGQYQNRLGETQNYTGQQLFIKLNLEAYDTAFPMADPPSLTFLPANPFTDMSVFLDGTDLDQAIVTFENLLTNVGYSFKLFATTGLSQGIMRPRGSLLKYIGSFAANVGGFTYDFTTEYFARFGNPVLGKKVYLKSYIVEDASGFATAQSIISATVVEPG